ncbi:MAG: hypothetical protein EAZ92_14180 [Candidatus Kapaibacterium sp.]|nr:MAG: hypothetical protein EAZ92_14180 [Candidatus Kapabacteria bacterium]
MHTPDTTPNGTPDEGYQPRDFTTQLGTQTLLVRCDYRLEQQAEWLLQTLTDIHATDPISEGTSVEIGWSVLTFLKDESGRLITCEPDYGESPFESVIPDVTMTLHIVAEQGYVIAHTHTEERARIPRFDETLVFREGVFEEECIYLEREEADDEESEGDSGWFIGYEAEDDNENEEISEDEFGACYVYELLQKRPELLTVLGLPPGYVVTFAADEIDAIMDENDNDVWNTENMNGVA